MQTAPAAPVVADVVVPLVVGEAGALALSSSQRRGGRRVMSSRAAQELAQIIDLLARHLADQVGDVEPEPIDVAPVSLGDSQIGTASSSLLSSSGEIGCAPPAPASVSSVRLQRYLVGRRRGLLTRCPDLRLRRLALGRSLRDSSKYGSSNASPVTLSSTNPSTSPSRSPELRPRHQLRRQHMRDTHRVLHRRLGARQGSDESQRQRGRVRVQPRR